MAHPTIAELYQVIRAVKQQIDADCRAHEDDETPGILITFGFSKEGDWAFQTGSNDYTGAAYHHPFWVVISVHLNSNCRDLARYVVKEFLDIPACADLGCTWQV